MNKTVRMMGRVFLFAVAMTAMLSSCIKEEALNAEADITGVSLGADSLLIREPRDYKQRDHYLRQHARQYPRTAVHTDRGRYDRACQRHEAPVLQASAEPTEDR